MKKLTEKDYEMLRKLGIKSFTTLRDDEVVIPSAAPKKKVKKVAKKKANANHPLVGKVLHTSWGYNMTINNFCKIIEVSPTGKTVVCRMLTKEGFNGFAGEVHAGNQTYGPKFRLKVKDGWREGTLSFNGSYPYIVRDNVDCHGFVNKENASTRMGYFSEHNPNTKVYENHMD